MVAKSITIALVWIALFGAMFFAYYFYLQFRNRERLALIDKGADAKEIFKKREYKFKFPWIRLAMLAIGIGFGLAVAYAIDATFGGDDDMLMSFSILICGGLGLLLGDKMERNSVGNNG